MAITIAVIAHSDRSPEARARSLLKPPKAAGTDLPSAEMEGALDAVPSDENIVLEVDKTEKDQAPQVEVTNKNDSIGDNITVAVAKSEDNSGQWVINIEAKDEYQKNPEIVHVKVIDPTSGNVLKEQDFAWGVIAFNPDYSIYRTGMTADLAMAVLDDKGKMVCDAAMSLIITAPSGKVAVLGTGNSSVKVNPDCAVYGPVDQPDYSATYQVKEQGEYRVKLIVKTAGGERTMTDTFYAEDEPQLEISRETATRIYPSDSYKVKIKIKANIDYPGPVVETIPQSFWVSGTGYKVEENKEEGTKRLVWDESIAKGEEKTFEYEYKAPEISPQFYLLGPAQMGPRVDAGGKPTQSDHIFREKRMWQIASDAPSTVLDGTEVTGTQRAGQHKVIRTTNGGSGKRTFALFYSANEVINLYYSDDPEAGTPTWTSVGTVSTGGNDESADMEWDTVNNCLYIAYGRETPADAAASDINYKIVTALGTTPALGTERVALNATTSVNFTHPVIEIGSDSSVSTILIYANYYNNTATNPSAIYLASGGMLNSDNPGFTTTANIKTWTAALNSGIISIDRVNGAKTVLFYGTGSTGVSATQQLDSTDANLTASYCTLGGVTCAGATVVSIDGVPGKMDGSVYGNPSSDAIWFSWLDSAFDINTRLWTAAGGLATEMTPVAGAAVVLGPAIVGNGSTLYMVYQKVSDTTILVYQSRSLTDGTTAWSGTETTLEDHASENLTYPSIGENANQDYLDVVYTTATNALVRHMSANVAPSITVSGGCFTNAGEGTPCSDGGAGDQIKVAVNGVLNSGSDGTVDGAWSFTLTQPASGAIMVFYRDGAPTAAEKATTVIKYDGDGGNVTNVKMYQSMLVIGADAGSSNSDQTIVNSDLDTTGNGYEYSDDNDVVYGVNAGTLTVDEGAGLTETLYIISGDTFRPDSAGGDTVTTHHLYFEGTFTTDNNTVNVAGDWTNAGTFTATTGTAVFNGTAAAQTITSNGVSFYLVTFNNSSGANPNINYTGALTVGNNTTLSNATRIASTNNTSITFSGTVEGANILTINSGSGAVTFSGIIGGSTPITSLASTGSGAVAINTTGITTRDVASNSVAFTGAVTLGAGVTIDTDQTTNDGTITFSSTVNSTDATDRALSLVAGSNDISVSGAVGATNDLASITFTGNDITLANIGSGGAAGVTGATSITATDAVDTGVLTLTGTAYNTNATTYAGGVTDGTRINDNATFTTSNDTIGFNGAVNSMAATNKNVTLNAGTAQVTFNSSVGATQSIGVLDKQGSGDVKFIANALTCTGLTLTAGTINNAATDSGVWTVNGTVTITSGTLKATTNNLSVSGNWANTGAFTANGGTVTLTGAGASTQEISGDNTFYNLTAQATTARNLKFESIKTQAVTNTLDIDGSAGQLITLTTITGTTQWKINPTNVTTVTYVDVNYSNNLGASICAAYSQSTNNNNTNWSVTANPTCNTPPNTPSSLVQKKVTGGATLATGDWTNETQVQFTATASDTDNPDTLYLCVEKDVIATAFSSTNGGDLCGTGVAYSGTPVTVSVTITGLTDASEYHWQAQVKDTASAYSNWQSYPDPVPNAESARDFGTDTTAPTGGTVYDGTSGDQDWNDGSLTSISGNWTGFDATASGLQKYEYAIRRQSDSNYWSVCSGAGTWQAGANWCDNGTGTSFTQDTLNLQTGVVYYVSLRTTDNANNTASPVDSNGQQVLPTLSFALSGNTISFANLNNINSWTDSQTATVTTSTNASSGYTVKAYLTDYLRSLAYAGEYVSDFQGLWSAPEAWANFCKDDAGDCGFGYTSSDTLVQGSNRFNGGLSYAGFSQTAPGDVLADHTDAVNGSTGAVSGELFTITYKVSVPQSQSASAYQTLATFIVSANY